jgi:peptidoglycan/xylan/chitin deacetylase (PgdA/CDA1 family)
MNKCRIRTRTKVILALLLALAAVPLFLRGYAWLISYKRPDPFGIAVHHVDTDRKVVALTYDDGPDSPYTGQIMDCLKKNNVKATFFVIGENGSRHPQEIRRMMAEGHEIGNHSWSHHTLVLRTPAYMRQEIERTDALLRGMGYTNEIYFRAPEGRKLLVLPWVLAKLHKIHILFDVVAIDWEQKSVPTMLERIKTGVRPGSIILLHDGGGDRSATVLLTDAIINTLGKEGYTFCTISQLLGCSTVAADVSRNSTTPFKPKR